MKVLKEYPISVAEVVRARSIVKRLIKPTQLIRYEGISNLIEAEVYVKHENHNPTGSLGAGSEAAAAITTLRAFRPNIEIIAVQAKSSSAAYHSREQKKIVSRDNDTFAGGFATGKAYKTPFAIYSQGLSDFVLLTEDEIYESIGMALHYTHNLAEGAGASTLMAAIKLKDHLKGKKVVLQMSGCNASPEEISTALSYPVFGSGCVASTS